MRKLFIFAIVGFFAQLIDGSLGMGYGATSSSLLLTFGIAPAVASASIHLSEIATTAASGVSHYKFGNVDKKVLWKLMIPGAISAFIGAAFLSSLPGDVMKPFVSIFLTALGFYILFRFLFKWNLSQAHKGAKELKTPFYIVLGSIAGFFDAIGGGGWGPINTPVLLARKGAVPRRVIGTVDTSEFATTVAASAGFLLFLGTESLNWLLILAFVIGGVLAAPLAAWLIKILPSYLLGVFIGGFIILTNANTLLSSFNVGGDKILGFYIVLFIGWAAAIFYAIRNKVRLSKQDVSETL
ncbi:sulfite exporter TauE/SafE family protein [Priestia filamentosa]|uniref:sulfite exporter TauE/SafE family protein n=1 Tax=Priestia filamentosa TaxID=1402861 RepID=UPI003F15DDB3